MSEFLREANNDDAENNAKTKAEDDVKAIAICWVFSEKSRAKDTVV